jgi:hypothetical protein
MLDAVTETTGPEDRCGKALAVQRELNSQATAAGLGLKCFNLHCSCIEIAKVRVGSRGHAFSLPEVVDRAADPATATVPQLDRPAFYPGVVSPK